MSDLLRVNIIEEGPRVNLLQGGPYAVGLYPSGPPGPAGPAGEPGPAGPTGPPGAGGDLSLVHEQLVASDEWIVPHTLNKQPSVTTVDTEGRIIHGQVYYSPGQVRITFLVVNAGFVYLN